MRWGGSQRYLRGRYSAGFTLLEMVLYAAALGATAVISINATLLMTKTFVQLRISRDLNSSAVTVLERVTREIREAYAIDLGASSLGVNPGRLMLQTKDSGGADTTVEFYVQQGILKVREGGIDRGALMSSSTQATSFVVRSTSNTLSDAVKIDLTLTGTRGSVSKTRNFFTTVVLRGSY